MNIWGWQEKFGRDGLLKRKKLLQWGKKLKSTALRIVTLEVERYFCSGAIAPFVFVIVANL